MRLRLSLEQTCYLIAFTIALALRLLNLGATPLSDSEAQWAVQALELGRGTTSVGAQPGYVMLTGLLFKFLPSTNALARLLPALFGSLIVFVPALLRAAGNRLNFPRNAAIVLAFGLALDPTLTVLARQVGSPSIAVTCAILALAALLAQQAILVGIFGGLALLGGPGVILGALGLALAYGLIKLLEKADWLAPISISGESDGESEPRPPKEAQEDAPQANRLRQGLYAGGATILVAGTLLLAYPLGLSGLAASLTSFINGWVAASAVSPLTPLAALLIYEALPLIFSLPAIVLGLLQRSGMAQRLSLWFLTALLIAILYPARQVVDLAWALIPLWGLAALTFDDLIAKAGEEKATQWIAILHGLFLVILLIVLRLNLLTWHNSGIGSPVVLGLTIGIIAMGLIATAMVAVGWSTRTAINGLAGGLVVGGMLSMLAANFWGTQAHPINTYELWNVAPVAGQADLLTRTIEQLSVTKTGLRNQIDILATVDTPSMHWALRNFHQARFAAQLAITDQPSIVITTQNQIDLQSSSSYRGQDFAWEIYPSWQGVLPPTLVPWLAYRDAPTSQVNVILWARADLFPSNLSASDE